jgi:hypothetical protein
MFVNLTPHIVRLNDGREFAPSGNVARVTSTHTEFINDICEVRFGQIVDLPDPAPDTIYIVSGLVAAAARRPDVVSPATGHPDARREAGQIISVPGFVRA